MGTFYFTQEQSQRFEAILQILRFEYVTTLQENTYKTVVKAETLENLNLVTAVAKRIKA